MKRIDAAHLEVLLLQRRHRDLAEPAAVVLALRRLDARADRQPLAVAAHGHDFQAHHGIDDPSWPRNFPESRGFRPAMTLRRPLTEVSGASGALAPPMSVLTQPGLSATTITPLEASVAASPL